VIRAPLAHVGGIPIEETLASLGPALLVAFGVAWANLRAGLRRARSRATAHDPPAQAVRHLAPMDATEWQNPA
jgi:hypothetical protein